MDNTKHNYDLWTLNGRWISYWGLTPTSDMADSLAAPADYKSVTTDENDGIDGCIGLYTNRKKKKREFSLKFYMNLESDSASLVHDERIVRNLISDLVTGDNSTGISVLQTENYAYRVVLNKIDKLQRLQKGKHLLTLSVIEVNPTNRIRQTFTWSSSGGTSIMLTSSQNLIVSSAVTETYDIFIKKADGTYSVSISGVTKSVTVADGQVTRIV